VTTTGAEGEPLYSLRFGAETKDDVDSAALVERAVAALVQAGLAVREVRAAEGTLEDLFAELTSDAASTSADGTTIEGERRDGAAS
jgi:hypothetical protein